MAGEIVGDYRILAKLGEGGMGEVFLAEHTRIFRPAAIKILRPELSANAAAVERLFAEARATALLRHPNIVDVLDCKVHTDGRAYIAMESLEGEDLSRFLRAGADLRGEPGTALAIAGKIASALGAAHDRGLVHRDVKPENVFLVYASPSGLVPGVKMLDFGVARFVTPGARVRTTSGALVGTPTYMSPEQCRGAGDVDAAADVYALGCVLFEMVTGRPPFVHDSSGELIAAHLHEPAPRAGAFNGGLPTSIDELLGSMLAKRRQDRPASMHRLVAHFDHILATLTAGAGDPDRIIQESPAIRAGQTRWEARRPQPGGVRPTAAGARTLVRGPMAAPAVRAGPDTIDMSPRPTMTPVAGQGLLRGLRRRDAMMVGLGALTVALAFGYLHLAARPGDPPARTGTPPARSTAPSASRAMDRPTAGPDLDRTVTTWPAPPTAAPTPVSSGSAGGTKIRPGTVRGRTDLNRARARQPAPDFQPVPD